MVIKDKEMFDYCLILLNDKMDKLSASPIDIYEIGDYSIICRGDINFGYNIKYLSRKDEHLANAIKEVGGRNR